MTTYSPALASQVGSALAQLVPGMPASVATAWATMESGVGNNPYGVEVGGHRASYPTMAAGIQAAANLLLTATQYSSIRSALRTSDPNAIASAITASPWNTPNSAYYAAQFTAAGFHIDLSSVPGSAGTADSYTEPSPAAGGATVTASSGLVNLATLLGLSPGTRISAETLGTIEKKVAALVTAGTLSSDEAQNVYAVLGTYAKTAGTEQLGGVSVDVGTGQEQPPSAEGVAATLVTAIGTAASPLLVAGGIIVAALVLAYLGIQRLLPAD